jgi:hypothetical protein
MTFSAAGGAAFGLWQRSGGKVSVGRYALADAP